MQSFILLYLELTVSKEWKRFKNRMETCKANLVEPEVRIDITGVNRCMRCVFSKTDRICLLGNAPCCLPTY